MLLTDKQEKFVHGLVAGLSQRKSYIEAYPSSKNWKDTTVDSNASKLLANTKVLTRYRELLKESSNMALWSREQSFNEYEWLKNQARQDIENQGVRQANSNAFLNALEGMNQIAFRDLELADKKLLAEIEKLYASTKQDQSTEDKLSQFIDLIGGALDDIE